MAKLLSQAIFAIQKIRVQMVGRVGFAHHEATEVTH